MRRKSVVNTDFKCRPKMPLSVTSPEMDISRTGKGSPVWEHVIPTKYPQRGILHSRTTGFVKLNVTLTSYGT